MQALNLETVFDHLARPGVKKRRKTPKLNLDLLNNPQNRILLTNRYLYGVICLNTDCLFPLAIIKGLFQIPVSKEDAEKREKELINLTASSQHI